MPQNSVGGPRGRSRCWRASASDTKVQMEAVIREVNSTSGEVCHPLFSSGMHLGNTFVLLTRKTFAGGRSKGPAWAYFKSLEAVVKKAKNLRLRRHRSDSADPRPLNALRGRDEIRPRCSDRRDPSNPNKATAPCSSIYDLEASLVMLLTSFDEW